MKKLLRYSLSTLAAAMALSSQAQDIHFSQFYETSILRNPSLTGVFNGDYRMSVMYRNQWASIGAAFQTAQAAAEFKKQIGESEDFIGFGLLAYYDRTGTINLQTLSGSVAVSYNKMINSDKASFVSLGLMGGYIQRNFDINKMTTGNQYIPGSGYDPGVPTGENTASPKIGQMDFGAGLNFSTNSGIENRNNYTIGVSGYHLTRPENSFYNDKAGVKQEFRFNVNASANWLLDDMWSAQFQGNFSMQGKYNETMIGGLVGRKNDEAVSERVFVIYAGCFMRVNDALIPVVKMDYDGLTIAASYDMNISKLKAATSLRGGFEISLVKTGLMSDPQRGMSKTICPKR
jgi:type IX secretion system PorP/SprF family membrane protein